MGILNSRELASIIWLAILFIAGLTHEKFRRFTLDFTKDILFHTKTFTFLVLMGAYVTGVLWILKLVNFWSMNLLKDSIIWFLFTGVVLGINAVTEEQINLNRIIIGNLGVVAVVEFLVNIHIFPFTVEFFSVPIITFLFMLQVVAEMYEKFSGIEKVLSWLLTLIGTVYLSFTIFDLVHEHQAFIAFSILKRFLLPLVLSIAFFPFMYGSLLYVHHERG